MPAAISIVPRLRFCTHTPLYSAYVGLLLQHPMVLVVLKQLFNGKCRLMSHRKVSITKFPDFLVHEMELSDYSHPKLKTINIFPLGHLCFRWCINVDIIFYAYFCKYSLYEQVDWPEYFFCRHNIVQNIKFQEGICPPDTFCVRLSTTWPHINPHRMIALFSEQQTSDLCLHLQRKQQGFSYYFSLQHGYAAFQIPF